jgi:hypothetical protein
MRDKYIDLAVERAIREAQAPDITAAASAVIERMNAAGYETPDAVEFFDSLNALYRRPSVEEVIGEELPQINVSRR